jgi:hypothetical protein
MKRDCLLIIRQLPGVSVLECGFPWGRFGGMLASDSQSATDNYNLNTKAAALVYWAKGHKHEASPQR